MNPQACRETGLTERTCDHWRKEYGGLKLKWARRTEEPAADFGDGGC